MLISEARHRCREEFTVTRKTPALDHRNGTAKKVRNKLQQSSEAATYLAFSESLGGPESRTVWRAPGKRIGLPEGEDE